MPVLLRFYHRVALKGVPFQALKALHALSQHRDPSFDSDFLFATGWERAAAVSLAGKIKLRAKMFIVWATTRYSDRQPSDVKYRNFGDYIAWFFAIKFPARVLTVDFTNIKSQRAMLGWWGALNVKTNAQIITGSYEEMKAFINVLPLGKNL